MAEVSHAHSPAAAHKKGHHPRKPAAFCLEAPGALNIRVSCTGPSQYLPGDMGNQECRME